MTPATAESMSRPVYREQTWAPPLLWVIVWGSCAVAWFSITAAFAPELFGGRVPESQPPTTTVYRGTTVALIAFPTVFTWLFARLDVEVWSENVVLLFWPARLIRRHVRLEDVIEVEPVTYRPIRDFGGWGVRVRGRKSCWNMRGNRAVRLVLQDGREVYVGSRHPQRLAERIRTAQRG